MSEKETSHFEEPNISKDSSSSFLSPSIRISEQSLLNELNFYSPQEVSKDELDDRTVLIRGVEDDHV